MDDEIIHKIKELICEDQNCDYDLKGDDYNPILTEEEANEALVFLGKL